MQLERAETVIGTGAAGFSGDSGPASEAEIAEPFGVTIGADGALYFCDLGNHRIRRVDLTTRIVTTIAGTGQPGNRGDGALAINAEINEPYEIRFDSAGNLYFVDTPFSRTASSSINAVACSSPTSAITGYAGSISRTARSAPSPAPASRARRRMGQSLKEHR